MDRSAVRRAILGWGPVILWTAGLFWGSGLLHRPSTPGMGSVGWDDKFQHVFGFAILAALVWRAVGRGASIRFRALVSIGYPAIYGMVDECHQLYVPGRSGCLSDWLADSAGALGMTILLSIITAAIGGNELAKEKRERGEDLRGQGQETREP